MEESLRQQEELTWDFERRAGDAAGLKKAAAELKALKSKMAVSEIKIPGPGENQFFLDVPVAGISLLVDMGNGEVMGAMRGDFELELTKGECDDLTGLYAGRIDSAVRAAVTRAKAERVVDEGKAFKLAA
ncbi:MAG: hypothetical protein OEV91_10790 [Desulfobulbaceae bacterium]|nr:hypothetical protein [Desulfobulbaceae bacterium]